MAGSNKRQRLKEGMVSSLEIPRDLAFKDAILTMTGRTELCIENYKSILQYSLEMVQVLTKNGKVRICGRNLEILYYTRDEMKIVGIIQEIEFEL